MPASFRSYKVKTERLSSSVFPPLINNGHPLAKWLKHAYVFSIFFGSYDAVTGRTVPVTDANFMSRGFHGTLSGLNRVSGSSASTGYIQLTSSNIAPPFTIVSHFRQIHNASSARALLDDDDGSARKFQFRVDGTNSTNSQINFIYFNTAGSAFAGATAAGSVKEGIPQVAAGRILANGTLDAFIDGVKGTTATVTGTPATTNNTFRAFNRKAGSPAPYGGDIYLELVFNTDLTDDQIQQISANPWDIFVPSTNYAYNRFREGEGQTTRSSWMLGTAKPIVAPYSSKYETASSVRSSQPQDYPEIDWSNPITRGLVFSHELSTGTNAEEVVTNVRPTVTVNSTLSPTIAGNGVVFANGVASVGAYFSTRLVGLEVGSGDFTIATMGSFPTGSTAIAVPCTVIDTGTSQQYRLAVNYNGTSQTAAAAAFVTYEGAFSSVGANGVLSGMPQVLVGRRSSSNHSLWVDGINKVESSLTVRNVSSSSSRMNVGNFRISGYADPYGSGGNQLWVRVWNRALTDTEIVSLTANPWQIFKPQKKKIYVDNTPTKLWTPTIWTKKNNKQPSQHPTIDRSNEITDGLVSAYIGSSKFDVVRNGYITSYYNGTTPTANGVASKPHVNYIQNYLGSTSAINIAAASDFTLVYIGTAELQGTNPGFMRSGSFTFGAGFAGTGNTFTIINGTGFRPWIRLNGAEILQPSSGAALVAGQPYVIAYRVVSSVSAAVAWNGIIRHTASHSTAVPAFSIYGFGSQSGPEQYFGPLAGVFTYNRALSDNEMVQITSNPWQIFTANKTPLVFKGI